MKAKTLTSLLLAGMLSFSCFTTAFANNVSLTIKDGQIKDVLGALSAISGKSIVADDSVVGIISIDLDDVPLETALDIVTRAKNLAYKERGGVIIVTSRDNMTKNFGDVTIHKLQYAKAAEIQAALKDLMTEGGKIGIDPVTNAILFTGSASDEQKVKSAIQQLDVATKQVTLEAKIIALNNDYTKELGVNWAWDYLPEREDSSSSSSTDKMGGKLHIGFGYTTRFQATLSAMITSGKGKILARPRLITIPGKEASIFIGDHIPVLTERRDNGQTTTSTSYVDAGIKLSYTPIVSDDDFITSVVHTEVSTPTLVSELKNYKITSRQADTNVRMKNGETLIIGGLINEVEQKTIQKVPLLSNIPILGELFKFRKTAKEKTEVMMILTPYITEAGRSPAIYDMRTFNTTISPVAGSPEEEEAKATAREQRRIERAKNRAENGWVDNERPFSSRVGINY